MHSANPQSAIRNPQSEEWRLETSHVGRRVLWFDRLDSTNSFALALARDEINAGLVVLAGEQTAGRGQHGRAWQCPGGAGVLMSVLLFPAAEHRRPPVLTAWAAVSVCETIAATTGLEATIKWPNDVLIQGRKVCGILIEQAGGTVAGIGLNINQPAEHFDALGLPQAASLTMFTGKEYSCRDIAEKLIARLDAEYEQLCRGKGMDLETRWHSRLGLVGKQVEMETTAGRSSGVLQHLSFGRLEIRLADNRIHEVTPECVVQIRGKVG